MGNKNAKDCSDSVNGIALKLRMLCETDTGPRRTRHRHQRFQQAMVRLMRRAGIKDE